MNMNDKKYCQLKQEVHKVKSKKAMTVLSSSRMGKV